MLVSSSQWIFPVSALHETPSIRISHIPLERELYDRSRGVEFLFRLGSTLLMPLSAMATAATWFHRFYMRYSMEDFSRQDVAAACIFLATKTEECGRKLRDVARVFSAKVGNKEMSEIAMESKELEQIQTTILATEEALLETLCFEFWVESPHVSLIELLNVYAPPELQDYAWSIAHDSFRTPLCVLYSARIVASACFLLAQKHYEGPNSVSLDARISTPAPSATLPTPPSHNPTSPNLSSDHTRFVADFFTLNEAELNFVADALSILIEYYSAQDAAPHTSALGLIQPPTVNPPRPKLYRSFNQLHMAKEASHTTLTPANSSNQTPDSSHGGSNTPAQGLTGHLDLS